MQNEKEYVEAIPGPPFIISKETYQKMQKSNQAKQNTERLESQKKLFKNIKVEEPLPSEEEESTF